MRRVGKEGLVGLGLKYAWCEMYALVGKPVRKAPFEYEFGMFSSPTMSNRLGFFQIKRLHHQWNKLELLVQRITRIIQEQLDQ
jgi:hypothetical protein